MDNLMENHDVQAVIARMVEERVAQLMRERGIEMDPPGGHPPKASKPADDFRPSDETGEEDEGALEQWHEQQEEQEEGEASLDQEDYDHRGEDREDEDHNDPLEQQELQQDEAVSDDGDEDVYAERGLDVLEVFKDPPKKIEVPWLAKTMELEQKTRERIRQMALSPPRAEIDAVIESDAAALKLAASTIKSKECRSAIYPPTRAEIEAAQKVIDLCMKPVLMYPYTPRSLTLG